VKAPASSDGTTPPGTANEAQAANWVRQMFSQVAPRYDLLNHLLSFNIDKGWRKRLLSRTQPIWSNRDAMILDLCCGTGDVLLELQGRTARSVLGADFCHPMLVEANRKIDAKRFSSRLFEGDALQLPLREESVDLVTISFGFRNLANYENGLTELLRILKPGGMLAILEFSHPKGAFLKASYGIYSSVVLPALGAAISGSREAYTYLPESIRKFPTATRLAEMMSDVGFEKISFELLTGGIAALHIGNKRDSIADPNK
jgi:demethylmenaquinone methyltransferase/2-methoxy-6-polyprenyl-1,4-benzoquinol methylase